MNPGSSKFHYYRWEPLRWRISETRGRCLALPKGMEAMAALGVYRELIDYCFIEGSIPSDVGGLAAVVGCPVEVIEVCWPIIKSKFAAHKKLKDRLVCDSVEMRKRRAKERSEKSSSNSLKRWQKQGINNHNGDIGIQPSCIDVVCETDANTMLYNKKLETRNKKSEMKKAPSVPKKAVAKTPLSAGELIATLQSAPAFVSIDVAHEFDKHVAWCNANHRHPTEKAFVNWLNRADTPLFVSGNGNHKLSAREKVLAEIEELDRLEKLHDQSAVR